MLVLITIVGLTIGLSLISRTVTDIRISSQIEQSGRAFSAAEAGVENALKGAIVGNQQSTVRLPDANGTYTTGTYSVSSIGNTNTLSFPVTSHTETQTIWLADHKNDGTLNEASGKDPTGFTFDLCWGTDTNNNAAIALSLFYKDTDGYKFARSAYDKNGTSRNPVANNFDNVVESGPNNYCDGNYQYRKTISPLGDFKLDALKNPKLLFLRIMPVYENTTFAIKANANLPVQGKIITSVGQTTTGVVRKIQVTQGYNVLPTLLDFTLFAETKQ
ncbi:hypothetical protein HY029_00595 [Candidatus Gottesmanbacteria bacterium]|nr:hypothetical protein [Candidatus Gottesmanbacteria bacterium]